MSIKCKLQIHPVVLVLFAAGLIAWIVALGGIAAATNFCYSNKIFNVVVNTTALVNVTDGSGQSMSASSLGSCVSAFSLNWWALWFEFFLLCIMFGTCFVDAFNRARFIYLSYLSMATFFLTISARDFITKTLQGGGVNPANYSLDAYNAAAAGAILLALINYCLIIFLGLGATTEIPDNVMPNIVTMQMAKYGIGIDRTAKYSAPGAASYTSSATMSSGPAAPYMAAETTYPATTYPAAAAPYSAPAAVQYPNTQYAPATQNNF